MVPTNYPQGLSGIDMSIIFDSIFPVFMLVALGNLLRRFEFVEQTFFQVSDRLVYFVFFPIMLFWKIGSPASAADINWSVNLAVLFSILTTFALSLTTSSGVFFHESFSRDRHLLENWNDLFPSSNFNSNLYSVCPAK